ncbi:MAG TPA: aspartate aminotransferase family protein [Terriglobales bacterium]
MTASKADLIMQREREHVLPVYARYPVVLERGEGVYVYDVEGKRYLDLLSGIGVNALGHAHPRMVRLIQDQCTKLLHISNLFYHEYQGELADRMCQLSGLDRAFFTNSGTEAVEGALKVARASAYGKGHAAKCNLVALEGSYHGRSFGALSVTGQEKHRQGFEPMLPGVTFVPLNDIPALRAAVDDNTCALILEPIMGEGGIRACTPEFLRSAREVTEQHDAVLILDEIQCGLGRTGTLFAYQEFGILPDAVAVAKPIAGGLPMGAFLVKESLANVISPGKHGTTFGGGPLVCRAALEYFAILEEEKLVENVKRVGNYLHTQLQLLTREFSIAKEARGTGFIQALELTVPARPIVEQALAEGLLINSTQDVVLRFLPPFILQERHVDDAVVILRKLLEKANLIALQRN